jgi:hypothetical protein
VADGATQRIVFDDSTNNLTLNASPVPEPGSWALMLAGVAARLSRRRAE